MDDLWLRIERSIRSLGASGSFGPPASDTSILAAEAAFGVKLPDDLRSSLAIHNGDATKKAGDEGWQSDGPFADFELLSLGSMLSEWQVWQDSASKEGLEPKPEGPVKALWWNPLWIPFTVIGGSTWHYCIDLDPDEGGQPEQIIEIADDESWRRVIAPSFRSFLRGIAKDLEAGRYSLDDEGRLVHESWA